MLPKFDAMTERAIAEHVGECSGTRKLECELELRIAATVIKSAMGENYAVSVWDGEAWCLNASSDPAAILRAMCSTDEDVLAFHGVDAEGKAILKGKVWFVWGNGCDCLSDYSDNNAIGEVVRHANALAESYT